MLSCLPTYRQRMKLEKPKQMNVRVWNDECIDKLQGCFDCTDWTVLFDDECNLDRQVDVITSYINFCTDMIIPTKQVTMFPNNKPWVTKELKLLLNEKKWQYQIMTV